MNRFSMTIDGSAVEGSGRFDVVNPADRSIVGQAPECTPEELDLAFGSALQAFALWRADKAMRRSAILDASKTIMDNVDDIAYILTMEQGKPLRDAKYEVECIAEWFEYYARLELPREVIQDDENGFAEVIRRPLGVVSAITPWNFPVALAAWKIAPALMAGNTLVLKPSPFTPLSSLLMGEMLRGVLPDGVLNVVTGGDELGAAMVRHPVPRKISFTGSVAAGRSVYQAAAPDLKRVTLELGGNDAAILLDDVNVTAIARKVFWGAFRNNGQICSAIKRVYAPENIYKDVVAALAEVAESVVVGNGLDERTVLGPINNRPQYERVKELIIDAADAGAKAIARSAVPDSDGYFVLPTIIADAKDGMRIVDEEQFGPALPVLSYRDLDDAIARANGTQFGLSGSVWSSDPERAAVVARRLECGTAWANTHLVLPPHQPFGGHKASGVGVENGPWGYYAFTDLQVIYRANR